MLDFARHHDRDRFEIAFFSPDSKVPSREANAELLRTAGSNLIMANSTNDLVCLKKTVKALDRFFPDILVSVAALADYRQYYLFAGCPAVLRVSLIYGPPPQFVPPGTDWGISGTQHPLIDSPTSGSVVEIETTLPARPDGRAVLPESVVIPEGAVVIMAAGRSEKFLDRRYWEAIVEVLDFYPNAIFIAFGLIIRPGFLDEILAKKSGRRIQILGWLGDDYRALLSRAHIFVDTYPSGGGLTIIDSMAFGIPVLTFANDYLVPFDQTNWNPAEEILGNPELVVTRGDFDEFHARLGRLIADPALRRRLGDECRRHVCATRGNPERMVRRVESEYQRLWRGVHDGDGFAKSARAGIANVFRGLMKRLIGKRVSGQQREIA
jgi:glycosyltransferase involved in cell wall biosynthesis